MTRKKIYACFLFLIFSSLGLFAQVTARAAADEAAKKETVAESVSYLVATIASLPEGAEKRSLYYFLGSLQEQAGLYDDACTSYAAAAAIGAGDAHGMARRTSEQLVLDAVRCALSTGDFRTANSYLNSAVRNSPDDAIQAYIKLYDVWSRLCSAENRAAIEEPVALLKAYSSLSNMEAVRSQLLFTLWYLTGEQSWAVSLRSRYPYSLEAGIVDGNVRLFPAPFWYFVPHNEITVDESDSAGEVVSISGDGKSASLDRSAAGTAMRVQLGLFRERANADALVKQVGARGFSAYITTEKRSSGATYFIVLVNDPDGSVATKLRSAGFECYRYD